MGICPSLEITTKNQNFPENLDRDLLNLLVQSWIVSKEGIMFWWWPWASAWWDKQAFVAKPNFSRKREISSSIPISFNEVYLMAWHSQYKRARFTGITL